MDTLSFIFWEVIIENFQLLGMYISFGLENFIDGLPHEVVALFIIVLAVSARVMSHSVKQLRKREYEYNELIQYLLEFGLTDVKREELENSSKEHPT
jgi:hypothetical protein